MKIYFEDGKLDTEKTDGLEFDTIIDAGQGVKCNITMLDWYRDNIPHATIYTNSIIAFSNDYAWNDDLKVPEIYIRVDAGFVRIDKLTDKELRWAHNLRKLYIAGEFEACPIDENICSDS